ncbi:MAG TPA: DUF488 family protein [Candidatus Nocardiopsis merdipullorum]|nr:DUF488 family protein [Candidatus Nocardiopsis merdipullorum]
MTVHPIVLKRVHDEIREEGRSEGEIFLVDRLWPRGVPKTSLEGVSWVKEVAPSSELRSWFGHDPERFAEFAARYRTELDERSSEELTSILSAVEHGPVTLLYAAKDTEHNHAVVLREWLQDHAVATGN